jgi:hypothetical protein
MNSHVKEQNGRKRPFCGRLNHFNLFLEENLDDFQRLLLPGDAVGNAGGF